MGRRAPRHRPVHVACQPAHDLVRPSPGNASNFISYYVRMLVLYENLSSTPETLSVDIPSATSIDLGYLRGGVVPEPATWGLVAAGVARIAWRRRAPV